MNDTRIVWVSSLVDDAQGCGEDGKSAVRLLHSAVEEWSGFAAEFPFGDVDVARVGILLKKSRGRFSANDFPAAHSALSDAMDAIQKVAAR